MKVKLLRQVRRRFEIVRYDTIDCRDHLTLSKYGNTGINIPFYIVRDHHKLSLDTIHQTYAEAHENLRRRIKTFYSSKTRGLSSKREKVWFK